MEQADVVIIGAGVAGLFAAHELVRQDFKGSITIVEQGLGMKERLSQSNGTYEALRGVGGPGLFTDGKICLDERAGTRLTEFIDSSVLKDYVFYVQRVLQEFLTEKDLNLSYVDKDKLKPLESRLQAEGLVMDLTYPVVHLGTERVRKLALSLEEFLRSHKVRFLTGTTAREIKSQSGPIEIRLEKEAEYKYIQCRYLIAAVGKSGHDWLCNQFKQWDIRLSPNTPDIGIRLEFPNSVIQQLISIVQNPRIVMQWKDTFIRTHCWCYGGRISTYDYLGFSVVDGETFQNSLTHYTSVNFLYRYRSNLDQDSVKDVHTLLQKIFLSSHGNPVMQSLGALRGESQIYHSRKKSSSSKIFRESHLMNLFPKEITEGFLEFTRRLDAVWPGIADSSTFVFAPVIEWDTYRFQVDENMRTRIPNVYAVGDGAGLTQGVVAAATCGIIAAKHLSQTYSCPHLAKQFAEIT